MTAKQKGPGRPRKYDGDAHERRLTTDKIRRSKPSFKAYQLKYRKSKGYFKAQLKYWSRMLAELQSLPQLHAIEIVTGWVKYRIKHFKKKIKSSGLADPAKQAIP